MVNKVNFYNLKAITGILEVKAIARFIRISPYKVYRILKQIHLKTYTEALMLLHFMPYKACPLIWKVISSAAANAKNNKNFNKEKLIITAAFVEQGPIFRRLNPCAKGQGYWIRKPTCHIGVTLTLKN